MEKTILQGALQGALQNYRVPCKAPNSREIVSLCFWGQDFCILFSYNTTLAYDKKYRISSQGLILFISHQKISSRWPGLYTVAAGYLCKSQVAVRLQFAVSFQAAVE